MNDSVVSISKGVEIKTLHDGFSAFAFIQNPLRVSLIGSLSLAICTLLHESQEVTLNHIRKILLDKAKLPTPKEKHRFDNAVVCAVGQLYEQGIIVISN